MFRRRRNSQKPPDDLYAAFKLSYPTVGPGTNGQISSAIPDDAIVATSGPRSDPIMDHRPFSDFEGLKDPGSTHGDVTDQWRFSPLLDNNAFSFSAMVNQAPGCYTPTPGGTTVYHNQAGDLHTPNLGFQLGTPLSLSTSDGHLHQMQAFNPHLLGSTSIPTSATFSQQPTFAPSSFVHQDPGFDTLGGSHEVTPRQDARKDFISHREDSLMSYQTNKFSIRAPMSDIQPAAKLRYQVTLNAPTAMVRHSDEIPITYLNKGQAYSMTISDSQPLGPALGPVKYRTVIRISFEDEEQRQRPSACWQLWKEGRGLAESHQRGGRLQAVEFVDPNQGGDEQTKRPRVELENASFDSFSVTWTPQPNSIAADCAVAVRFNFLSTDFSHSKGVKGIPVRLCAKTEMLSSSTPDSRPGPATEVCFCKVKLFRDHGAERKLSNDISHIKKTIEKLKQQITQAESGSIPTGKRKRSGSKGTSSRPVKIQKHNRTWSISSHNSMDRPAIEDDFHVKLATMEDMFTSTRPVSVLYLKGYPQDDPDKFPVALPGPAQDLMRVDSLSRKTSWDQRQSAEASQTPSTNVEDEAPTPSSQSIRSQPPSIERPMTQTIKSAPPQLPRDWDNFPPLQDTRLPNASTLQTTDGVDVAVKVPRQHPEDSFPDWIEALGVDPSYVAPPERATKPVACFYVLIKVLDHGNGNEYYRAVYLMERTLGSLVSSIAAKWHIEASQIARTIRVNARGLKIMVDDETVRELPEGQDMIVEFSEIEPATSMKLEPETSSGNNLLEMRLLF